MGFSFTQIEPNQIGQVTKYDVPLNQWMGLKFGAAFDDTFGTALSRFTEDQIWDDGNRVRPDIANKIYGIEGHLQFDEPINIQIARLRHDRKRKELERQAYLESASHSWASGKAVAGFGAALVGSIAHPLDLGLAFLPFIGSEKAAAGVARLGHSSWRQSLQRGLISEEALGRAGIPFHRLTASVIDGTVNQAIVEIPVAIQKYRDQADYTQADAFFNIFAGGAFAGGLKSIGLALERAARLWNEADPRVRMAAIYDQASVILTGEKSKAGDYFGLDDAALRAKVEEKIRAENPLDEGFINDAARIEAAEVAEKQLRSKLSEREIANLEQEGFVAANTNPGRYTPAIKFSDGRVETGASHDAIPGKGGIRGYVDEDGNFRTLLDVARREMARAESAQSASAIDPAIENIAQKVARGVNLTKAERDSVASLISSEKPTAYDDYLKRVDEIERQLDGGRVTDELRAQEVQNFLTKQKADHEAKIKGLVDEEVRRVTEELRKADPKLPEDVAKKFSVKPVPDDANIKAVEEETASMQEAVLSQADTPEAKIALQKEIDDELAHLEETQPIPDKAIDEMIPCVVSRSKNA